MDDGLDVQSTMCINKVLHVLVYVLMGYVGVACALSYFGTSSIAAVGVVAPVVLECGDWLLEKRDSSLYVLSLAPVNELMIEGVEIERSRDTFLIILCMM